MERAGEILAPRTKAGRTLGLEPHPLDTVMVVKRWLWDNDPSQQIAVAIPFQFMERFFQTQGRVPVGLRPPNPPLEAAGWLRCAVALLETHEEVAVQRPVRYLRSLARGERGQNNTAVLAMKRWHMPWGNLTCPKWLDQAKSLIFDHVTRH